MTKAEIRNKRAAYRLLAEGDWRKFLGARFRVDAMNELLNGDQESYERYWKLAYEYRASGYEHKALGAAKLVKK